MWSKSYTGSVISWALVGPPRFATAPLGSVQLPELELELESVGADEVLVVDSTGLVNLVDDGRCGIGVGVRWVKVTGTAGRAEVVAEFDVPWWAWAQPAITNPATRSAAPRVNGCIGNTFLSAAQDQ